MSSPPLPLDALPGWAHLNGVDFLNVELQHIDGKGLGLVATQRLSLTADDEGAKDDAPLVKVPRALVLSPSTVEDYAKVDQNFRQLLDAAGHQVNTIAPQNLGHLAHQFRAVFPGRHLTIPTSSTGQFQTRSCREERCGFDCLDRILQVLATRCPCPYPVVGARESTPPGHIARGKSSELIPIL